MADFLIKLTISVSVALFLCFLHSLVVSVFFPLMTNWTSIFIKNFKNNFIVFTLFLLILLYSVKINLILIGVVVLFYFIRHVLSRHKINNKHIESQAKDIIENWLQNQTTMTISKYSLMVTKEKTINLRLDISSTINYHSINELRNQLPQNCNISINNLKKKQQNLVNNLLDY